MSVAVANLKDDFLAKIRSGYWKRNEKIPTETQLMRDYCATRNAVRNALKLIEQDGVLTAVRGSGRRVTGDLKQRRLAIGLMLRGGEMGPGFDGRGVGAEGLVFRELSDSLRRLGHHSVIFSINQQDGYLSADDIEGLPLAAMDGLIVFAQQYLLDDIARLARQKPTVAINHDATAIGVPSFFIDYGYHTAVAVQELYARGHRRIAMLCNSSPFHSWMSNEMKRGYGLAHRTCGMEADYSLVFHRPLSFEAGEDFYDELLSERPGVTAAVVYGGLFARGMVSASNRAGSPVPQEISIVQVTDAVNEPESAFEIAHFQCPNLEKARDAVETLRKLLDGEADDQVHRTYYGEFEPGDSIRNL